MIIKPASRYEVSVLDLAAGMSVWNTQTDRKTERSPSPISCRPAYQRETDFRELAVVAVGHYDV